MALQNQTFANSGSPYYGNPADWSKFSTINDTILFNDTEATIQVIPAVPDKDTTITFNGNQLAYLSDIPDLANWAQYPANNDVLIDTPYVLRADTAFISTLTVYSQTTQIEVNISTFTTSTLTVTENAYISTGTISTLIVSDNAIIKNLTTPNINNSTVTITADNQNFPLEPPTLNIISKNGLGGNITLTADSGTGFVGGGLITLDAKGGTGLLGLNGAINIRADPGDSGIVGVTTGGRIDITANSGINDVSLTSAVKISGAGVNIQSGITSPITSVAGYTFVGGNLGVNSCAGIPAIIPNVPGTNYMYGTNGIVLNSDVYTTDVYPYWDGVTNPDDLSINGRTVNVGLGAYNAMVSLNNVNTLAFESSGFRTGGAITGISSINGLNSGPMGAIQFSDGAGAFQGNSGLRYDGVSRIANSNGNNFIDINESGNNNSIAIQSLLNQVNITAKDILGLSGINQVYITAGTGMVTDINSSKGSPGQVLTSDGTFTTWENPTGLAFVDSYQIYVSPNGNDSTGTGSSQNPYLTIGRAIIKRATLLNTIEVSIILSSGTYTESPTLVRNTYLVGVPTGEARQPCNIVGTITMNDTAGTMGISGLEITGTLTATSSGAVVVVFACNITTAVGTSITSAGSTLFVTESRISNSTNATISASSNVGSITIRDCIIQTAGGNSCILSSVATTIRQSYITSLNATNTVLPLIKIINNLSIPFEISFCKIDYTSPTIDVGGNKCCIQFAGIGSITGSIFNNMLRCEGAITGSPNPQCIQNIGAGAVTLSTGNLQCIGLPNFIAPTISSTPMYPVLQSRYASFTSNVIQIMATANTPQIITHNTTEINTGGFTLNAGSIQVLKAGNYEVGISIQFRRLTGASVTNVNFWFRVNGVDVPRSCSQISITGNDAEFLATVSIIPSLNVNDIIQVMFGGPDTAVEVYAEPAELTPMVKPAIPSIITNIKLLL